MGRIISVVNQKGGVGKTTTAVNLSASLAELGRKVLLIDIDPQGNATSGVGVDKEGCEATLYDVFSGTFSLSSIIVGTVQQGLWLAPANADLVGCEVELSGIQGRELILKDQLSKISDQFEYIIIDCPPSLGLITVNALVATETVLVPLQCEYYALEGISSLLRTIEYAKENLNPDLELEGVILTMFDGRTKLSREIMDEAQKYFGEKLFSTVVTRNIRISESPSFGKPINHYAPDSPGALAYAAIAEELEARWQKSDKKADQKAQKRKSKK